MEIKFQYIYELLGTVCKQTLTLEQIEEGLALKDSFPSSEKIIAKRLYSGLKDENGVEIYDGDIVCESIVSDWIGCVSMKGGSWLASSNKLGIELLRDHDWKVIGNIHQNPELLEK